MHTVMQYKLLAVVWAAGQDEGMGSVRQLACFSVLLHSPYNDQAAQVGEGALLMRGQLLDVIEFSGQQPQRDGLGSDNPLGGTFTGHGRS